MKYRKIILIFYIITKIIVNRKNYIVYAFFYLKNSGQCKEILWITSNILCLDSVAG
jgi:hypothetical protein